MLLRRVAFPDFCEPCLPSPADKPPAGAGWLHEIKHDGFRMLVRRNAGGVRLFTRNGHDWTGRFPLIAPCLPTRTDELPSKRVWLVLSGRP
jgi:bifunctional non-homologous end joining protein LigD